MLELFKKQNPFTLFFVILYGFAIRSSIFFIKMNNIRLDADQPFSFLTDQWCKFNSSNLFIHYLITTSLLLIISIILNIFLKNNKIIDKLGFLPTLIFMLISASFSSFLYISNEFVAFLFFSIAFIRLIQALLVEDTEVSVFDASFFMSIASLFYKPLLPCFLIVFLSIIILKSVQVKAIFFMILGLLVPYFLLGVYMFITDRLGVYIISLVPQIFTKVILFSSKDYLQVIKIIFIGVISFMGFISIQASLAKSIVNIRKFYSLLLIVVLVFLPMFLINKEMTLTHFMFLLFPISYYILNFLKDMKRVWISELIHVALFVLIYFSNFNY